MIAFFIRRVFFKEKEREKYKQLLHFNTTCAGKTEDLKHVNKLKIIVDIKRFDKLNYKKK